MKSVRLSLAVCGLGLALAAPSLAQDIAVRAGTVITMAGSPIKDGMVLIRGGRIVEVGPAAKVKVPAAVKVITLKDGVVMPGMVNPNTFYGMGRYRNETNPVLPFISAADGINPMDNYFKSCLQVGYTSLHVIPYRDCILGGTGLVVRPCGKTIAAMAAADVRIQKISLSKRGLPRIRAIQMLEQAFVDMDKELKESAAKRAEDKAEAKAKGEKKDPKKKDEKKPLDARKRDLAGLVKGKGKAFFYCAGGDDLRYAIGFARKWRFKMIPVLSNNCWKHVRFLKMARLPAILDTGMEFTYTDPVTDKKEVICMAAKLHKLGIPFALTAGYGSDIPSTYPLYQAAAAVRNGVPRDVALKALTTTPAKMLGLGKRLGSLEKGKDGNLVLLNGDPLATFTLLEKVIIDGKLAYSRDKDPVMKDIVAREKAAKAAREKAAKEKAAKEAKAKAAKAKAAKAKAAKAKAAAAKKKAAGPVKKEGGK